MSFIERRARAIYAHVRAELEDTSRESPRVLGADFVAYAIPGALYGPAWMVERVQPDGTSFRPTKCVLSAWQEPLCWDRLGCVDVVFQIYALLVSGDLD